MAEFGEEGVRAEGGAWGEGRVARAIILPCGVELWPLLRAVSGAGMSVDGIEGSQASKWSAWSDAGADGPPLIA